MRLVWVVQPETRTIDAYRPDEPIGTLGEQDALDGLDVLPGFTCELSSVFGPQAPAERPEAEHAGSLNASRPAAALRSSCSARAEAGG